MDTGDERGQIKRKKKPNTSYAHAFWSHYDEDTSDVDSCLTVTIEASYFHIDFFVLFEENRIYLLNLR